MFCWQTYGRNIQRMREGLPHTPSIWVSLTRFTCHFIPFHIISSHYLLGTSKKDTKGTGIFLNNTEFWSPSDTFLTSLSSTWCHKMLNNRKPCRVESKAISSLCEFIGLALSKSQTLQKIYCREHIVAAEAPAVCFMTDI